MSGWYEAKMFVERVTMLSMDALHVVAGVLLLFGASLLLRRPVTDAWPWLAVLAAAVGNEAVDYWLDQWPSPGMQAGEAVKDILFTMILPTIILISARHLPQVFRRDRISGSDAPPAGEA